MITDGASRIEAQGRFSLGYPRKDHGEEINAVIKVTKRPLVDLRNAFQLQDYPVNGLLSGDFHLFGAMLTPDGVGKMQIDDGVAYGETFEAATSDLRFEHTGVRLDAVQIKKSTGKVTGAAWVAWDGAYSFDADGANIPVESMATLQFKQAPLSGILGAQRDGRGHVRGAAARRQGQRRGSVRGGRGDRRRERQPVAAGRHAHDHRLRGLVQAPVGLGVVMQLGLTP